VGGARGRAAHERVSELGLDWSRTSLWFGDERAVAPDHEHSNFAMAKASLLDRIGEPEPAVHRIPGELGHEAAARVYGQEMHDAFRGESLPRLDLVLLGLGPDAHCASLFPGDPALGERERWVVEVETPGMAPFVSRVTVTLPVLNAARDVVFLISGTDKAEAVARAFADAPDPGAPASLVRPGDGTLTVLLDPPAAARLGGAA
jgi:6-phosphogluconolactonase